MKSSLICCTILALATTPSLLVVDAKQEAHVRIHIGKSAHLRQETKSSSEFCWRNSQTRGVGGIPQGCDDDKDRIGLLCYPKCPEGMGRFGFDCHSKCPEGMEDQGLFCRRAEYGRGAGYAWQFGDALNDSGMTSRCEKDNGAGNCEKSGLIMYPKCKPGYSAFGCCICRPDKPDCGALGLGDQVDLSCGKKIIIGAPSVGKCQDGQEIDAGLCYPFCNNGYKGVGPVCWASAPEGWVECGMGAAKDTETCVKIIKDQVMSVGELALNIATAGGAKAATSAEKVDPGKLAELKNAWDAIKDRPDVKQATEAYENAEKLKTGFESIEDLSNAQTAADYVRFAATVASILDPTGISGVIAAYAYDTCDHVTGESD